MTHEHVRDALPFYVLGALDSDERAALDTHLSDCADCRQELAAEWHVQDALARAVDAVPPPAGLRTRVLAVASRPIAAVAPFTPRQTSSSLPWVWQAGLAAAATVALVTSIGWWTARNDLADLRATLATMQGQLADAEARAAQATGELGVQRAVVRELSAPDVVQIRLAGQPPATSARALALFSRSEGTLLMSARGLPALDAARTYQLWLVAGSTAISAGTFTADATGRGQVSVRLPSFSGPPAAVAITVEPQGGVPQPTGPKYLLGAFGN